MTLTLEYDSAKYKVVPKDAIVLDLSAAPGHVTSGYNGYLSPSDAAIGLLRASESKFASWVADQISAQTKPPRIPEPGLWGVVEAILRGDEKRARLRYIRTEPATWLCVGGARRSWSELIEPKLIRPGVE